MSTKAFNSALDFLPAAKPSKGGPGVFGLLKTILEAFEEGRTAQVEYRKLIARGMTHEQAARKVILRG